MPHAVGSRSLRQLLCRTLVHSTQTPSLNIVTRPMLFTSPPGIPASEITPKKVYLQRRQFLREAAAVAAAGATAALLPAYGEAGPKFHNLRQGPLSGAGK